MHRGPRGRVSRTGWRCSWEKGRERGHRKQSAGSREFCIFIPVSTQPGMPTARLSFLSLLFSLPLSLSFRFSSVAEHQAVSMGAAALRCALRCSVKKALVSAALVLFVCVDRFTCWPLSFFLPSLSLSLSTLMYEGIAHFQLTSSRYIVVSFVFLWRVLEAHRPVLLSCSSLPPSRHRLPPFRPCRPSSSCPSFCRAYSIAAAHAGFCLWPLAADGGPFSPAPFSLHCPPLPLLAPVLRRSCRSTLTKDRTKTLCSAVASAASAAVALAPQRVSAQPR